jgi:hypothetical protein
MNFTSGAVTTQVNSRRYIGKTINSSDRIGKFRLAQTNLAASIMYGSRGAHALRWPTPTESINVGSRRFFAISLRVAAASTYVTYIRATTS